MPPLSNARHETFAQLLAKGKSADEAYSGAGFKPNRGNAATLKANQSVKGRVEELVGRGASMAEVTVHRVIHEMARLGFSDVRRAFTPDGAILSPREWDDDFAAAVASIEVVSKSTGEKDEEGRPVVEHVHKIKMWDKNSALDKFAKHLGMFIERIDHTSSDGTMTPKTIELVALRSNDDSAG